MSHFTTMEIDWLLVFLLIVNERHWRFSIELFIQMLSKKQWGGSLPSWTISILKEQSLEWDFCRLLVWFLVILVLLTIGLVEEIRDWFVFLAGVRLWFDYIPHKWLGLEFFNWFHVGKHGIHLYIIVQIKRIFGIPNILQQIQVHNRLPTKSGGTSIVTSLQWVPWWGGTN